MSSNGKVTQIDDPTPGLPPATSCGNPPPVIDYEAEYNNSARVANSAELVDAFIANSAEFRQQIAKSASLDLAYGKGERNKLDIFWPSNRDTCPISMFIHGGYWQRLDRTAFSHLAQGLLTHGVAVAIPSYTLCPNIRISGIIDEMRRACVVMWQTFKRPLTVFGHSAGGHLAACMAATRWSQLHNSLPPDLVRAGMGISGLYDLEPLISTSINNAVQLDETTARAASPIGWLIDPGLNFDAWVGEEESSEFHRQSQNLAERWTMLGANAKMEVVPQTNHFTVIHALQNPQSPMVQRLLELIGEQLPDQNQDAEDDNQHPTENPSDEVEASDDDHTEKPPANDKTDDLTRISGVGETLVTKLNGLGYATFSQIAALTPAEIEHIDQELDFKGRIERDNWVDQARTLMGVTTPENDATPAPDSSETEPAGNETPSKQQPDQSDETPKGKAGESKDG